MTSSPSALQFTENHTAAAKLVQRKREMLKRSVVKTRQGLQPFSSPTIFGDDVIIHKKRKSRKKKNVSMPLAQLEQK